MAVTQTNILLGTVLAVAPWRYHATALTDLVPAHTLPSARLPVVSINLYVNYSKRHGQDV